MQEIPAMFDCWKIEQQRFRTWFAEGTGCFCQFPGMNDYTPTKWFLHGFCMGYKTIDDNAKLIEVADKWIGLRTILKEPIMYSTPTNRQVFSFKQSWDTIDRWSIVL